MLRIQTCFLIVLVLFLFSSPRSRKAESAEALRRLTNTPDEAINLNPSLSDNGLVVAFESTADLTSEGGGQSFHAFRADLSSVTSLIHIGRTRAVSPSLSSDGQKMAFASNEDLLGLNPDRNSEIYFFDGASLRQLTRTTPTSEETRTADGNFQASISGDGQLVAFSSNRNLVELTGNFEIYLCSTATGVFTRLTANTDGSNAIKPKLSADGSRVAFILVRPEADDLSDLMTYDRLTATTKLIMSDLSGLSFTDGRALSSDGMRIVYSANTAPNQSQVFLFDVRENISRQITQLGTRISDVNLQPTLSGDGKRVAFATRRRVAAASDGSVELYVFDLPSAQVQQVTNAPASATAEIVSSLNFDGSLVAFNFPRVLSAQANNNDLANNSEIYTSMLIPRPKFGVGTVHNGAAKDNEPAQPTRLAPGSIATFRGHLLAFKTQQAQFKDNDGPLVVAGTTVRVNDHPAQILYASPDELIFVVPSALSAGPADIVSTNADGFSSRAQVIIAATAPGVFTVAGDGRGEGIILDAGSQTSGPFDPSDGQLRLAIFTTGVRNASRVSVSIAGQTTVAEAVASTNMPGLDEVHALVPSQLRGSGSATLLVIADGTESNPVTVVIAGSALRDVMINEILADPPDGLDGDANHDGVRDTSGDEFVELVNSTTRDLNLSGYLLLTRNVSATNDTVRHRFAPGTVLPAGTALVVFGGGNSDLANPIFGGAQVVKASTGGLSLVNSGAVITLQDSTGAAVASISYGTDVGLPGDTNQSLTRSPDITGSFALHSVAAVNNPTRFSPGTRLDGKSFHSQPPISFVNILPPFKSLSVGDELQFVAQAFDVNNNEMTDVIYRWISSAPTVLRIDENGLGKALGPGTTEVIAIARNARSSPSMVTVIEPTPTPTPTPVSSPSPSPSPMSTPTSAILISEFRTRGPNGASDEFVEIYNNSDLNVDISGWKIRGSSSSGVLSNRLTISPGTIIPARRHFLAANSTGYGGPIAADQTFTTGLANDGGLAVTLPNDLVIDQVGLSSGSSFREGTHLSPLPSDTNQSYERKPGDIAGSVQDSGDNLSDFVLLTPSDPQNSRSTPAPSPSPTPTPALTPSPSPSPSASPTPTPVPSPSPSPSPSFGPSVVISQFYGGGGNTGATFRNDFIEIFNSGSSAVSLAGWSVQYASAAASTWSVTNLPSIELAPGKHYLIQEASSGSNGLTLPAPDVTGTIAMAVSAGKLALVRNAITLVGSCPNDPNIVDLLGYGSTATCFRGPAPASATSNTTALIRVGDGCTNSKNSSSDFMSGTPNPRSSSSPLTPCTNALAWRAISSNYLETWPSALRIIFANVGTLVWTDEFHERSTEERKQFR
jgi:uncharacterized protein (TIGR03437 family)